MVIIKIYVEGGVLPNANLRIQTLNNSERLRESFYKLLSKKLDPTKFKLHVEIGSGVQQSINFFKSALKKGHNVYLLIDLDVPKNKKLERLNTLAIADKDISERVFFMIQEMEAWILSQPNKIEECYHYLKRVKSSILLEDDKILKGIHPEDITKPSTKLHTILGRYYREEKKGKLRKKKYNKLRDGADLLELLSINLLEQTFDEVRFFLSVFAEDS